MRSVSDSTFDAEVLNAGKPVIVDFWAPWCGPCKAIEPVLELLGEGSENAEFVKLDIDENPVVASRYDVLSIPTVIVFADGAPRAAVVGARPRAQYERAFADYL